METTKTIISLMLLLSVLVAYFTVFNSFLANNYINVQIENKELLDLMNKIKTEEEAMALKLSSIQTGGLVEKILGFFDLLFYNVYRVFSDIFITIPSTISSIINFISNYLPVPSWLTYLIFTAVFALIGSWIILIVMKVRV